MGAWLVPQAIEVGGAGRWISTALLLATGLHGACRLCLGLWGPRQAPGAPAAARAWSGPGSAVDGFVDELREHMDTRLGGTSRVQLPAGLPEPVSLRQWLEEELSRRALR